MNLFFLFRYVYSIKLYVRDINLNALYPRISIELYLYFFFL